MKKAVYILKFLRKVYILIKDTPSKLSIYLKIRNKTSNHYQLYEKYIDFFDQNANDYIREYLSTNTPCLIAKFGTIELSALANYVSIEQRKYSLWDIMNYIICKRKFLWWNETLKYLCSNAGFFPNNEQYFNKFCEMIISELPNIDVLGSYIKEEDIFNENLSQAIRVNLNGYYAPFLYKKPWTQKLKGKKVLVVHPFDETIRNQYNHRAKIWKDPDILPEFELITIKAVQTIAGEKCTYADWFDALDSMKKQISETDFDIALIGCGAYGMPLAAHAKKMGKQAIHLAGWLQVLFGIKGKRWTDMPSISKFMNEYWVYPLPSEIPNNYKKIENGCYW